MTSTALIISTSNPPRGALERKVRKTGLFAEIVVCETGRELIATLGDRSIALICWAFGQGETDAPEWLEALKINPAWADIPLLAFTKERDAKSCLQGLELGACDSVTFVTPTAELSARIQGHLKRAQQISHLRNRRAELAQMALNDPLTGLANRTSFDLCLSQELARSHRSGYAFSLLMIDLDYFKWFNDCYGHQTGDTILRAVAKALRGTVRDSDIACRYGGEEFTVILPGATVASATQLAERLHQAISELSRNLWQDEKSLTVSIGLTCFDGTRRINSGELIAEADTALYQAKDKGRNRTEIFRPKSSTYQRTYPYAPSAAVPLLIH